MEQDAEEGGVESNGDATCQARLAQRCANGRGHYQMYGSSPGSYVIGIFDDACRIGCRRCASEIGGLDPIEQAFQPVVSRTINTYLPYLPR